MEKKKHIALITLLLMASTATALASPGILATKNYAFSINIPAFGSIYDQEMCIRDRPMKLFMLFLPCHMPIEEVKLRAASIFQLLLSL